MNSRQRRINEAFVQFESGLRIMRWQFIDQALSDANVDEMTSQERDEVDLASAVGLPPFGRQAVERGIVEVAEQSSRGTGSPWCDGVE